MLYKHLRLAALITTSLLSAGCFGLLRPAPTPMPSKTLVAQADARCTLVLLPGMRDRPGSFERHGFGEDLRRLAPGVELIGADAHFGYYRKRTVVERLSQDVLADLEPARRVWLVGVSLGGVGTLIYQRDGASAASTSTRVDPEGLLLLAPFLGEEPLIAEIAAAGGPAAWQPSEAVAEDDFARLNWLWLKDWAEGSSQEPAIYLGYGLEDDFAPAGEQLAQLLPADRIFTAAGGHDWQAWRNLWQQFLESPALDDCR